jgi:copper homeostasis protein
MTTLFEVCVESMQGLVAAQAAGAQRVELCSNLSLGGTTPSAGLIQLACKSSIDVVVLLRPRAGDFVYSDSEFELIAQDLAFIKACGAAGVALLQASGQLDLERCAELVRLAAPMEVCFHRAFDFTAEPLIALEQLIQMGVGRVLTSGCRGNALLGLAQLKNFVERADGRIEIMPGGGVRVENVEQILSTSGAHSIHFSASEFVPNHSIFKNPNCSLQSCAHPTEFELQRTSESQIRAIIHASQA